MAELMPIHPSQLDRCPVITGRETLVVSSHDDEYQRITIDDINDYVTNILGVGTSSYYGIEWDTSVANSACKRIGRHDLHQTLPIQSRMRRCLLLDNGTVNYYLDANDSTKRENGTPAKLDGTDGQVMVEIPEHYRKFETEGTIQRCLISEQYMTGSHFVPLCYRSAYEPTMQRSTNKLASVVNNSTDFRGGDNTTAWDGTYRSLLGKPLSNTIISGFRTYARNRGVAGKNGCGWNADVYEIQKTCFWLYAVEYANFNCQLPFKAQPTSEGLKQGGLGNGVTTLTTSKWNTFNTSNPFIPCGHTNRLGNNTGVVAFTMPAEYGVLTLEVPSYRGLENLFGHLNTLTDGFLGYGTSGGGIKGLYVCRNPVSFSSVSGGTVAGMGYELRGVHCTTSGYVKRLVMGEYGENIAAEVGGDSTTFFCDLHTSIYQELHTLALGGGADSGAGAGMIYAMSRTLEGDYGGNYGTRLCYIPA